MFSKEIDSKLKKQKILDVLHKKYRKVFILKFKDAKTHERKKLYIFYCLSKNSLFVKCKSYELFNKLNLKLLL